MEHGDEIELLNRLQQGETEAYLVLYDRYHLLVYNWALPFVKVPHLAEDLVQEVFLKIWEIRARLNPQLSFPAFLYRIARNKAFSLLKKISTEEHCRSEVMHQLGTTAESAENRVLWHQYQQLLSDAVHQLPMQRQKVFKLCRQEGKSYEEVAMALNISRNTVKEHMVLAVKDIREYFHRYGDLSFMALLLLQESR